MDNQSKFIADRRLLLDVKVVADLLYNIPLTALDESIMTDAEHLIRRLMDDFKKQLAQERRIRGY